MKKIIFGAAMLTALIGFTSVFVSCGSSNSPSSPATPTPVPATATPTNTPLPTPPPYKTSVGAFYDPEGFAFSPSGTSSYAVYDNSNGGVTLFNSSFTPSSLTTTFGTTTLGFNTWGVAVDPNTGNFYVMDRNNKAVDEYTSAGVTVAALTSFGSINFSAGLGDIAIAPNGNLYVVDTFNGTVYVFNSAGATITSWSQPNSPNAIAVSPISPYNVYVGTSAINVIEYSSTGTAAVTFGGPASSAGVGQGQFEKIIRIGVGPNGNVYVSDGESAGNKDDFVQEFSPGGTYLTQWGGNGTGNGQFVFPGDIAFNAGDVYVCDQNNNRIQVFGP
jgi:tripartite motif-containing protein 71